MKISEFLSENFYFLMVKFSVYLTRHVFVIHLNYLLYVSLDLNKPILLPFDMCEIAK